MAGVNTSNWVYANWREGATAELRLQNLVRHMTEVSQAVVEQTHTHGRSQRMNVAYLQMLRDEEKSLRSSVAIGAALASNTAPVVLNPQF